MGWFSWIFIKILCVNRNPKRNTVMMTTRWPREWWILLWFCSFPLEFSKGRNDQKSNAKSQYRPGSMLSIFSYTLQIALNKKLGSNSQFWNLDISNNFFLRSGSLTRGGCPDHRAEEDVQIFKKLSRLTKTSPKCSDGLNSIRGSRWLFLPVVLKSSFLQL